VKALPVPESEQKKGGASRPLLMDSTGRMIDSATVLQQKGFEVGHYVRKDADDDGGEAILGLIQAIQQDVVTVYSTSKAAAQKTLDVKVQEFLGKWSHVMNADEMRDNGALPGWPLLGPPSDKDGLSQLRKGEYLSALYSVWDHFNESQGDLPLMVNWKPRRHVVTTKPLDANSLVLVPYATSLVFDKMPEKGKHISSIVVDSELSPKQINLVLHIQPFFSAPTTDKPNQGKIVPFWAVDVLDSSQSGSDAENCELISYICSNASVFPEFVSFAPRQRQKRTKVPVLVLTKAVGEGTRLAYVDKNWVVLPKQERALKATAKAVDATKESSASRKRTAIDMLGPEMHEY
jgi:hypothetical protein